MYVKENPNRKKTSLVKAILFCKNHFIWRRGVSWLVNRYFWFFQELTKIVVNYYYRKAISDSLNHVSRNKCEGTQFFINFRRNQEFNFEIMLKVPNCIFRSLEKKLLEFCEATKSNTSALYNKKLSTVVKCFCGWNPLTLHSFFSRPLCMPWIFHNGWLKR